MSKAILILTSFIQAATLIAGQMFLKYGMQKINEWVWKWSFIWNQVLLNWGIIIGLIFIIFGNLLWLYMLKVYPFSVIYPLTSIGFIIGMLCGMWLFGETVVWTQWIGVLLIMIGCWFIVG